MLGTYILVLNIVSVFNNMYFLIRHMILHYSELAKQI